MTPLAIGSQRIRTDPNPRPGGISLAAMARHLGREASYLLRGVSELEQAVGPDQRSAQLDTIVQKLRSARSGFRV